jgi:hypothetical protein
MTIITRNVINKNIIFYDYNSRLEKTEYTYEDVCKRVNFFKNYLLSLGAKKGESVLIGFIPELDQISLFFAVCELGLNFIVNDYKIYESEDFDFIDTKTELLMPINYFFGYDGIETDYKNKFLSRISERFISYKDLEKFDDYTQNDIILAESQDIIMKCTSSGTTGTPKRVLHTHEFLYNISNRNTLFFNGHVGLMLNMNHGSSLATYFIPALISSRVNEFSNIPYYLLRDRENTGETVFIKDRENILKNLDYLMIPYGDQLEKMIEAYDLQKITYYILSAIPAKLKKYKSRYKDIVSFFGCNETSGPVLINNISREDFSFNHYYKPDEYYQFKNINPLTVFLKEYNLDINTNDIFLESDSNLLEFKGRNDLLRINGTPIKEGYDKFLLTGQGNFIYDTLYNEIYLAIWTDKSRQDSEGYKKSLNSIFKYLDDKLRKASDQSHSLSKVEVLYKENFMAGVKLDYELLRSYFRKKVKPYDQV